MRMLVLFVCMLAVFLLAGCVHNLTISPTLSPTAMSGTQLNYSTAVYFASDVRAYVESAKSGSVNSYNANIGDSLSTCLLKAVSTAYNPVAAVQVPPKEGEYDRVLKFSVQNSDFDVNFQREIFWTRAKSQYTVSLIVEAYDGRDMELVGKFTTSGNSFGSEIIGTYSAERAFAQTIETGVQQLCDGVANPANRRFCRGQEGADPKSCSG